MRRPTCRLLQVRRRSNWLRLEGRSQIPRPSPIVRKTESFLIAPQKRIAVRPVIVVALGMTAAAPEVRRERPAVARVRAVLQRVARVEHPVLEAAEVVEEVIRYVMNLRSLRMC